MAPRENRLEDGFDALEDDVGGICLHEREMGEPVFPGGISCVDKLLDEPGGSESPDFGGRLANQDVEAVPKVSAGELAADGFAGGVFADFDGEEGEQDAERESEPRDAHRRQDLILGETRAGVVGCAGTGGAPAANRAIGFVLHSAIWEAKWRVMNSKRLWGTPIINV
jgi:hypothetical protein